MAIAAVTTTLYYIRSTTSEQANRTSQTNIISAARQRQQLEKRKHSTFQLQWLELVFKHDLLNKNENMYKIKFLILILMLLSRFLLMRLHTYHTRSKVIRTHSKLPPFKTVQSASTL